MHIRLMVVALLGTLLSACNPSVNIETAERQIKTFHSRYNDGAVDTLYDIAGDELRKTTTREEMADFVTVVSTRLGKVEMSEQVNWNVAFNNGVSSTVITMETDFEKGEGLETFTFQGTGDDLELVGWLVNSPRLSLTVDDLKMLEADDEEQEPDTVN